MFATIKSVFIEVASRRKALLILTCLSIVVFANTLTNEFVLDDMLFVVEDEAIRNPVEGIRNLPYFRPVSTLTFIADYAVWGLNPMGYHLTNLLLHILCVLCLYFLVTMLFRNPQLALLTGLLFAAHPIHTGAVTAIAHRKEVLAMLFSLIAFMCYIKKEGSKWYFVSAVVCYLLALFSKESAAMALPLMLVLYDLVFARHRKVSIRRHLGYYLVFAVGLGTFLIYKGYDIILYSFADEKILMVTRGHTDSYLPVLYTGFRAILKGLRLLAVPHDLSVDYRFPISTSVVDPLVLAAMCVVAAMLVVAWRAYRKYRAICFGIVWIVVFIIPVSNLIPLSQFFVADRYLYIPSAGFCLAVGVLLQRLYAGGTLPLSATVSKVLSLILVVLIMATYAFIAIRRNAEWASGYRLWSRTVEQNPESVMAHANLGLAYYQRGQPDEAIAHFEEALRIDPSHSHLYDNLASAYSKKGLTNKAITLYKQALRIAPQSSTTHLNLGLLYLRKRMLKEAASEFKSAQDIAPRDPAPHFNLAVVHFEMGQLPQAAEEFRAALRINPGHAQSRKNLGSVYFEMGMFEEAVSEFTKAAELLPSDATAYFNLGKAYLQTGRPEHAISAYRRSLGLAPDFVPARFSLGAAYMEKGMLDSAIAQFKVTASQSPGHVASHINIGTAYFQKGLLDEAAAEFRKVLDIDPGNGAAHFNLGNVYFTKGLFDKAIDAFKAALHVGHLKADAHYNLALCYLELGQQSQAIRELNEVLKIDPEDQRAARTMRSIAGAGD